MFLKNKNIIFKIRRSKVTDYAALKQLKGCTKISGSSPATKFGVKVHYFFIVRVC